MGWNERILRDAFLRSVNTCAARRRKERNEALLQCEVYANFGTRRSELLPEWKPWPPDQTAIDFCWKRGVGIRPVELKYLKAEDERKPRWAEILYDTCKIAETLDGVVGYQLVVAERGWGSFLAQRPGYPIRRGKRWIGKLGEMGIDRYARANFTQKYKWSSNPRAWGVSIECIDTIAAGRCRGWLWRVISPVEL